MCQVKLYHSMECKHTWMEIIESCSPGMGFNNCPLFTRHGTIFDKPRATLKLDCPWCRRHGDYCTNTTRVVTKIRKGIKIGALPHKWTPGLEVPCVVM